MTAPARAASIRALSVQNDLLSLTVRMTEEYPELPAGSVMRCVARSIRRARRAGVPRDTLAAEAERRVRVVLAGRLQNRASASDLARREDDEGAEGVPGMPTPPTGYVRDTPTRGRTCS